jgi:hypothetical protein
VMLRLTPNEFRQWRQLARATTNPQIEALLDEIEALGGPVCIDCEKNKARYTSSRCALCDMQLPEEQRGERL